MLLGLQMSVDCAFCLSAMWLRRASSISRWPYVTFCWACARTKTGKD